MPDDNKQIIHVEGEIVDDTPQTSQALVPVTQTVQAEIVYGVAPISAEESEAISAKIDPKMVEIRPDGLLYLPGNLYRSILNNVFGVGQWALKHLDSGKMSRTYDEVFWYQGELWVRGAFISEAIGEQAWKPNNANASWITAREGAKTDCLVRCCKDLGIANELWNPQYTTNWKRDNAKMVKMVNRDGNEKWFWFRKDQKPYMAGYKEVQNG